MDVVLGHLGFTVICGSIPSRVFNHWHSESKCFEDSVGTKNPCGPKIYRSKYQVLVRCP